MKADLGDEKLCIEEGVVSKVKPVLGSVFIVAEESPSFLLLLGSMLWESIHCAVVPIG